MIGRKFMFLQPQEYVLYVLENLFNATSTSLKEHKLPMLDGHLLDEIRNKLLREDLNYDIIDLIAHRSMSFPSLNRSQKDVYEIVVGNVIAKQQALIFVHGRGGTLKTFLWRTIINFIKAEGLIVLVVAFFLLPGGQTAYSRFKIPLNVSDL